MEYLPLLFTVITITLGGCSSPKNPPTTQLAIDPTPAPFVEDVKVKPAPGTPPTPTAQAVTGEIVIKKNEILNRTFAFQANSQHSSFFSKLTNSFSQDYAYRTQVITFRKVGNELQGVLDTTPLYLSTSNHPEELITRFTILSETPDSFVVSQANSVNFFAEALGNLGRVVTSWTRSIQWDSGRLVQESTLLFADDSEMEFIENLFPYENLTPSPAFQKIEVDYKNRAGEGKIASRYRILSAGTFYKDEKPHAYGEHFDIGDASNPKTIDWYITANAKDEDLLTFQQGVEGWNRYFKAMKGIERDVLKFKGRLPDGIKLGDSRYNVINLDEDSTATAAFASTSTDANTGRAVYAMIYIAKNWLVDGKKYWSAGKFSESPSSATSLGVTPFPTNSSSGENKNSAEESAFAHALLRATIFHEIGHTLGLAHNFKGSLSLDRSRTDTSPTTSIMDYNVWDLETQTFSKNSADGPLLEYDRQALSAIYNKMADVSSSDPVEPVCSDYEADDESSGKVDPLCNRFDSGKDPTLAIQTAFKRITEEHIDHETTLSDSLAGLQAALLQDGPLQALDSKKKQDEFASSLSNEMVEVVRFYLIRGNVSVRQTIVSNIKSLYQFVSLPAGYSEKEMHDRAFAGVQMAIDPQIFSDPLAKATSEFMDASVAALMKTPYALTLTTDDQAKLNTELRTKLKSDLSKFESNKVLGLPQLTIAVINELSFKKGLPFFFGKVEGTVYDFETSITQLLFNVAIDDKRLPEERKAAAKSLSTYSARLDASTMISKVRTKAQAELKAATDNQRRELAQDLLNLL